MEAKQRKSIRLPKIEIWTYFCFWTFSLLYVLYNVYLEGQKNEHVAHITTEGWSFLQRRQDIDNQLNFMYNKSMRLAVFIVLHVCATELIRKTIREILPVVYFIISILFLLGEYKVILCSVLVVLLNFVVILSRNKHLVWFYNLTIMCFSYQILHLFKQLFKFDDESFTILLIICTSMFLKGLCSGLSILEEKKPLTLKVFVQYLGYMYYFPNLILGYWILYADFEKTYGKDPVTNFTCRLTRLIKSLAKFTTIIYAQVFLSHYLFKWLVYVLPETTSVSYATATGSLCWFAASFYLSILGAFGIAIAAARAEGMHVTDPPICVLWAMQHSYFWKHFDRQFYLFHSRYIYKPALKYLNRHVALALPFMFVAIWHTPSYKTITWCALNYSLMEIEVLGNALQKTEWYKNKVQKHISAQMERRLAAMLNAPLAIISILTNFIFFTDFETVRYMIEAFLAVSFAKKMFTLFVLYCKCQVCIEVIARREEKRI